MEDNIIAVLGESSVPRSLLTAQFTHFPSLPQNNTLCISYFRQELNSLYSAVLGRGVTFLINDPQIYLFGQGDPLPTLHK